jgi:ADP-ribosylglycohydrolase
MLPDFQGLKAFVLADLDSRLEQGQDVAAIRAEVEACQGSYDGLDRLARRAAEAPLRPGWPYVEPLELEEIVAEWDPVRTPDPVGTIAPADAASRTQAAFLGSVCGCMLGKPLEVRATLAEIRAAAESAGEWPLRDYVTEQMLAALGRRHRSWEQAVRGRIDAVAPDDDINYTVAGMLLLESRGPQFTQQDVMDLWLANLPVLSTFGPERTLLLKAGVHSQLARSAPALEAAPPPLRNWASAWNAGAELCGAQIRADAYGYACPGRPEAAARLAWRDASWTHRRTGVYATMFTAAAIAAAFVVREPLAIFSAALRYVPRRSRFAERAAEGLALAAGASDWLDGYDKIHARYSEWGHCRIYQETATLMNTLRFASDTGHGICLQVSQGNDADSYGATAGSILGAFHGPGGLDARWLAPFGDRIYTTLATFRERSLAAVAARMGRLASLMGASS